MEGMPMPNTYYVDVSRTVARLVAAGGLSLPVHHGLVPADAERVVSVLLTILDDPAVRVAA
jgi:dTDP-4-amino-4,6-dideoxygalactose transaminase